MKNECLAVFDGDDIGDATYKYAVARSIPNGHLAELLWNKSSEEEKIIVFINYFDYFSDDLSKYLKKLPEEYKSLAKTNKLHLVTLENNDINLKLGSLLENAKHISSCKPQKENLVLRVRA